MTMQKSSIAVLGAGSWGTALALLLARSNNTVRLWVRDQQQANNLQQQHSNARYLPGITLPETLTVTSDLGEAIQHSQDILIAVPSHAFRQTLHVIKPLLSSGQHRLAWATKGFEIGTGKLMHQILNEEIPTIDCYAVISGPTFAMEVAKGLPTAVTVAANDSDYALHIAGLLHHETFRAYTSNDVCGVEIGGSVKNALAIATGIADGLGFGANTRAALITRGLAEMMRLGQSLGGQAETFMGLAGLGDLVLTCTDNQSRNRRFGLALGQGMAVAQAQASIDQVVEGIQTVKEVHGLAIQHAIDMPIAEQVYQVIYANHTPREAVHALLAREQKPEHLT